MKMMRDYNIVKYVNSIIGGRQMLLDGILKSL